LPVGNKAGKLPKQGVFHGNISLCLSLRPYMLDTVAISAIATAGLRPRQQAA
jgi:hypothetical protein